MEFALKGGKNFFQKKTTIMKFGYEEFSFMVCFVFVLKFVYVFLLVFHNLFLDINPTLYQ